MRRQRFFLAALLGGMGVTHFAIPQFFERLVPEWVPGSGAGWNVASGAAELASAALLSNRRTARAGGWAALTTLAVVYVANIEHAVEGRIPGVTGWMGTRNAALLRLPLQLPLLWWSWRIAHSGGHAGDPARWDYRIGTKGP